MKVLRVDRDEAGLESLSRQLQKRGPQLIVMEASGGYERRPAAVLMAAGLPVAIVNPRQVRDFARSLG
ncbi:MAG: IS110 family transposase, partial [Isosphaeraceae bacterium]